jgi:hypothetical protein
MIVRRTLPGTGQSVLGAGQKRGVGAEFEALHQTFIGGH